VDFLRWEKINENFLACRKIIGNLYTSKRDPRSRANESKQIETPTMKKTLSTNEIANALRDDKNADWSWDGAKALAEYLEQLEEETGEEMELDVIAIRCDFSEYESLEAWAAEYSPADYVNFFTYDDPEEAIRSYIQDRGTLIEFDGGVIVSSF
jgi:hypothetical protein